MSKELTEQWRNGTLKDGDYWCEITESPFVERVYLPCCDDIVVEVLAPVPTYEEWVKTGTWYTEKSHNELLKKIEKLEQLLESETLAKQEGVELVAELEDRLKEANKTLMYVAAMMTCDPADMLETYPDFCADQWALDAINKYLEKYGVEK